MSGTPDTGSQKIDTQISGATNDGNLTKPDSKRKFTTISVQDLELVQQGPDTPSQIPAPKPKPPQPTLWGVKIFKGKIMDVCWKV